MMRKSTMLRLLCLAVFSVLASFGVFNVTAQPAFALECAPMFGLCTYSHISSGPDGSCCMYLCPNGSLRRGLCEQG